MSNQLTHNEEDDIFVQPQDIPFEVVLEALNEGDLILHGLMPWSSNYTFLGRIIYETVVFNVIYKPCEGERPLWDFEQGTLCQREVASYVVSQALGGWPAIPPTILRDGTHGPGSVQQFIHADYEVHYFTLKDELKYETTFKQLAVFDYLVNNADRKGGHCLLDPNDKIWGIDHGLTFHTDPKLRTVIWKYASQKIPSAIYKSLQDLKKNFMPETSFYQTLSQLISQSELEQFCHRLNKLLTTGRFPRPLGMRDYPYPPI